MGTSTARDPWSSLLLIAIQIGLKRTRPIVRAEFTLTCGESPSGQEAFDLASEILSDRRAKIASRHGPKYTRSGVCGNGATNVRPSENRQERRGRMIGDRPEALSRRPNRFHIHESAHMVDEIFDLKRLLQKSSAPPPEVRQSCPLRPYR